MGSRLLVVGSQIRLTENPELRTDNPGTNGSYNLLDRWLEFQEFFRIDVG
jgi:hypothetical protein